MAQITYVNTNKNGSIEFFRFLFMSILVIWHGGFHQYVHHGYLVVEFFFILSGYLIYKSFVNHRKGTLQYTVDRIKRTYFEYAFACILAFGLYIVRSLYTGEAFFVFGGILKFISELLLLQNVGIFDGGYNAPMWYFSVLIWGGGFLYSLLCYNQKLATNIVLPLLALFFYTYIFGQQDSIESWGKIPFYIPMFRGISDMSLGILVGKLSEKVVIRGSKSLIVYNIVSLICLLLIMIIIFQEKTYDKYVLILMPILIMNCVNEGGILRKLLNRKLFIFLGDLTFEIYLLHSIIIMILAHLFVNSAINDIILILIYWLVIFVLSLCFKVLCRKLKNFLFNEK